MPQTIVTVYGLEQVGASLRELGPSFTSRLIGPALAKMASVVRNAAKIRNFGFTDRNGARASGSKYKSLRRSIRVRRIAARYGGRRYKSGRAAVFAGGSGAQQSHLVEEGHEGPAPAPAHPYLFRALTDTVPLQENAFSASVRARFFALVSATVSSAKVLSTQGSFGRTISRRARSR